MDREKLRELLLEHVADASSAVDGLNRIFAPEADQVRMSRLRRGFEREIEITELVLARLAR